MKFFISNPAVESKSLSVRDADFRYSFFNPSYLYGVQERERLLFSLLKKRGWTSFRDKKILDVGCGAGRWLTDFLRWGAMPEKLWGIDLVQEKIECARQYLPAAVSLHYGNATHLPFENEMFDVVIQSTLFTSVLNQESKNKIASEMKRVLKKTGIILWYDFCYNNPANAQVQGVKKKEIELLFEGCLMQIHKITLAPPLARFLAPWSLGVCFFLSSFPFLCTHYLGIIQKKD